jgi:RNA polymerase sigma-70 factor (ECF subfamily)
VARDHHPQRLPARSVANRELRSRIKRGLRALDLDAREVVVLRDVVGMSGEETAAALGLSLAAMKSRLHRGRLALKERLEDPAPGPPAPLSVACADVLEELSPYLDGELGPDGRAAVELHLRGCDRCSRFGGEVAAMLAGLRGL